MITDLKPWIDLANFVIAIAAAGIAFFATRSRNVDKRFEDVRQQFKAGSDRMDRHEGRLARIEQTVSGLPSREDIHKIELHMVEMNGAMTRMEAVLQGNQQIMARLETVVTRHEEHLLRGSDK